MDKEELEKEAGNYADKHAFRVPYDGSNKFYDDVDFKASKEGYLAGAEPREKRIAELEAQIEKMKCCMNCTYYRPTGSKTKWNALCESVKANKKKCCKLYKWEIKENG